MKWKKCSNTTLQYSLSKISLQMYKVVKLNNHSNYLSLIGFVLSGGGDSIRICVNFKRTDSLKYI